MQKQKNRNTGENMKIKLAVAAVLLVMAPGCATVVKGGTQSISVSTSPEPGATCVLTSPSGVNLTLVTPNAVTIERSKHDISVTCNKEGFEQAVAIVSSKFNGVTLGNILIGGVIGVGIDAASGAMNDYPSSVNVQMTRSGAAPAVEPAADPAAEAEAEPTS